MLLKKSFLGDIRHGSEFRGSQKQSLSGIRVTVFGPDNAEYAFFNRIDPQLPVTTAG